jgi:hypothetical protein
MTYRWQQEIVLYGRVLSLEIHFSLTWRRAMKSDERWPSIRIIPSTLLVAATRIHCCAGGTILKHAGVRRVTGWRMANKHIVSALDAVVKLPQQQDSCTMTFSKWTC